MVSQPVPIQPTPLQSMAPTAMSVRYSYSCADEARIDAPTTSMSWKTWRTSSPPRQTGHFSAKHGLSDTREDLTERDMRIFGGSRGESGGDELKAPMLDVVLGLFDGLDYDDDAWC